MPLLSLLLLNQLGSRSTHIVSELEVDGSSVDVSALSQRGGDEVVRGQLLRAQVCQQHLR